MVQIANIITALWLAGWAGYAVNRLSKGDTHSALTLFLVHFIFCGIHPALDVFVGIPDYQFNPGFREATADFTTSIIYCLYVCACPVLWWLFAIGNHPVVSILPRQEKPTVAGFIVQLLCYTVLVTPVFLTVLSPNPVVYTKYAYILTAGDRVTEAEFQFHTFVSVVCKASVFAGAFLLLWARRPRWILVSACLLLAAWIDGKRNIVVLEILVWSYSLWNRGYIRPSSLWKLGVACAMLVAAFSVFYQTKFRRDVIATSVYDNVRIDYGRDDVIKQAIYCELYPDEGTILEYRGQSWLFHLTTLVPRRFWEGKPDSYAVYVTSRMLKVSVRRFQWGVTTSILDESIANFSWIGMLIGPLILSLICRFGDSSRDGFVQLLTVAIACLLLVVHLTAFYPIFLVWLGLCIWRKLNPISDVADADDEDGEDDEEDNDEGEQVEENDDLADVTDRN
jgi:hypothetical protein